MTAAAHTLGPLAQLAAWPQFILVKRDGKIPVSTTGTAINAHDPAHRLTYDTAAGAALVWGQGYGVGFVLTAGDPFFCLDIDDCLMPDGTWSELAQQLVAALPGCAVEVSQSGRGQHIWGRWPNPTPHGKKNTARHIELYTEARFILLGDPATATGAIADTCPDIVSVAANMFPARAAAVAAPDDGPRADWLGPTDDDELLRRAMASASVASKFGGKATFAELWAGDADALAKHFPAAAGGHDGSSADMSLASHLAFWTGCDVARIDRLMRRSGLVRSKWDDRPDYLVGRTIVSACERCGDVYRDPRLTVTPVVQVAPGMGPVVGDVAVLSPGGHDHGLALTGEPCGVLSLNCTKSGTLPASLGLLVEATREIGLWVGMDRFTGLMMMRPQGAADAVPLTEIHPVRLRRYLEQVGVKTIKPELMRDVLRDLADFNSYDSAQNQLTAITWDGVPRIDGFFPQYLGTENTPYARACGAYWFTGLAGRTLAPGCKADMAIILVGAQGAKKSSALAAMALHPDGFGELDMALGDADLARQMLGKQVLELPELKGMNSKDSRQLKSFMSRAVDEWIPKYCELAVKRPRRGLCAGTTNEHEFLNDPTGERRYLPVDVEVTRAVDVGAIRRDIGQLWAEGAARYLAHGVAWQAAQSLAKAEHAKLSEVDEWAEPVREHCAKAAGLVQIADLWAVVGKSAGSADRRDALRMGKVLRGLGRISKDVCVSGLTRKYWVLP